MPRYFVQSFALVLFATLPAAIDSGRRFYRACLGIGRGREKRLPLLLAVSVCFAGIARAQVSPGIQSFSAYDTHEIDSIDLSTNNIIITGPLYSKPGIIPLNYSMTANSFMYEWPDTPPLWTPSLDASWLGVVSVPFLPTGAGGLLGSGTGWSGYGSTASFTWSFQITCPDGITKTTNEGGWYIVTADGSHHSLPGTDTIDTAGCEHSSFTDQTTDGSGLTLAASASGGSIQTTIYTSSGMTVTANSITDRHGNVVSVGSGSFPHTITDSMGLAAATTNGLMGSFSWTDANGGSPAVTPTVTTTATIRTAFGCSGINDFNQSNQTLLTKLSYPDGTSLSFAYETTPGYPNDYTGRIGHITLREGGTITYTYSGGSHGIHCSYQSVPILTRQTSDGTTTYTLAYSLISGTSYKATNTVVDNGGNTSIYTFTGFTSSAAVRPILTEVQRYKGSSTLLNTDVYCYNTAFASCSFTSAPTASVTFPVTSLVVMHQINGMSSTSATETHYDSYGNVTYSAQYDFGGQSPVRATTTTYGSCSASCKSSNPTISAIGANINNKPGHEMTTLNGSIIAQSNYTYSSKGDLLTTYEWTGSGWLNNSTLNSYNANGTYSTLYDLANNPTTFAYSSGGYASCGSCANFPFPTSITKGGLSTSSTWNGIGGVKLADTDANGNTTNYCYSTGANCVGGTADPFWRVLQTIDPYGSTVIKTYPTGSSPDTMTTSFTFNSGSSIQSTTTTTDGYGRTIDMQTAESPSPTTYDTVSTQYLWSGNYRKVQTTRPCPQTALGGQCSFSSATTTSLFDPLGRAYTVTDGNTPTPGVISKTYPQNDVLTVLSPAPTSENNKQTQKQYDGLGRLQSSCGIMVSGGYSSCSQNNTGYSGRYTTYSYTAASGSTTTTATRGSQSRITKSDGLGRVTQKKVPEAVNQSGTEVPWTYYYDSSYSSCPTGYTGAPGQLEAAVDPDGNVVCYAYDGLNRVTGVNANGTTCRHFYYDNSTGYSGSIPSGVTTPTNSLGRTVEAATDACSSGTLITDEWFSYDKDGRVTDMWELTPNSTQYYHSVATFFGNGAINTLELASPNVYTSTYGIDGEGRLNTLKVYAQQVVSNTTYNAASQPTNIAIGTSTDTDYDGYSYDNTGRMSGWTFQVGKTPATQNGVLTWNPNGTLNNVAITDQFYSGGTQTCYFNPSSGSGMGYDDLGRLLNDSCGTNGSIWNQTFSYDQYDNITKSSSGPGLSWIPGYNSANNHYTLAGTSYDSSGNITNDSMNVYAYNEFGRTLSINASGTNCASGGSCLVYDGYGRLVEIDSGSSSTEIWYTQLGKTAYMNGITYTYAYWPTPGGSTLLQKSGGFYYYQHKDWLGSARISSSVGAQNIIDDRAFAPYGEMYNNFGSTSPNENMFTGDTQDIMATGNCCYDTPNRELSGNQGRWLSPDPAGAGWSLYAYPTNPNSSVDPMGLAGLTAPFYKYPFLAPPDDDDMERDSIEFQIFGYAGVPGSEQPVADAGESSPQTPDPAPPVSLCFCSDDATAAIVAAAAAPLPSDLFDISPEMPDLQLSVVYSPQLAGMDPNSADDLTMAINGFKPSQAFDGQLVFDQLSQMAPAAEDMIGIAAAAPPVVVGGFVAGSTCALTCITWGLIGLEVYKTANPDMEDQPANVPENAGHPVGEEPGDRTPEVSEPAPGSASPPPPPAP